MAEALSPIRHRWRCEGLSGEYSCRNELHIEKALAGAKALIERLRDQDDAAESLIEQTRALSKRMETMKHYQEEIQDLNEVARHGPLSILVMGIQQENRQMRTATRKQRILNITGPTSVCLGTYNEQVSRKMFRLLMASKKDDPGIKLKLKEQHSKELQAYVDQITEMAAVMRKAIETDEQQGERSCRLPENHF